MRSERRERGVNMYRIQKGVERPFAGEKMERFRTCTRSKKGGGGGGKYASCSERCGKADRGRESGLAR